MGGVIKAVFQLVGMVVGFAIGGPLGAAIGAALGSFVGKTVANLLGLGAHVERPDTAVTSIKTSRPPRVSAYGRSRLYGAYVLYESAAVAASGGLKAFPGGDVAIDVYAVHDGKIDGVEVRYLNDEAVTVSGSTVNEGADGRYRGGVVQFYTTDGSAPGAGIPVLVDVLPGIWTANHRGDGVVLVCVAATSVKAEDFQKVYPQSSVPTPSIVARWQKCPDPSAVDPLDESAWTWTENPVRQLLHYKIVREGAKTSTPRSAPGYAAEIHALRLAWWNRRIAPTLAYWITAAAACDAPRALKAGGTEPKYRSCVQHKHTDEHMGPTSALLATFDGWLCPRSDGALVVYAGAYYAPTVSIGPDEILSYTWEGGDVDESEAVNEVICSYTSALHDYNVVECDAWRDESDITARGQILSSPLDAQVPSHAQARFLAKRLMARKNAKNWGSVTTNIAGRIVQGHRFVNLHLEEAGAIFYSGPVEITGLSRSIKGGVTFTWVAASADVDAWNPTTEEGNPAAKGDRVAPAPLTTPTIDAGVAVYDADGLRMALACTGPDRGDLTWYAHWRVQGASVWGPDERYSDTDPGAAVVLVTNVVPAEETIEVQVAYTVGSGDVSDWSATELVDTSTAALAPAPASALAAADGAGSSVVTWRNPTSANFSYAKLRRGTTNVFSASAVIGADHYGGLGEIMSVTDTVAAGTYYYWVVAYSGSGVAATPAGPDSAVVT